MLATSTELSHWSIRCESECISHSWRGSRWSGRSAWRTKVLKSNWKPSAECLLSARGKHSRSGGRSSIKSPWSVKEKTERPTRRRWAWIEPKSRMNYFRLRGTPRWRSHGSRQLNGCASKRNGKGRTCPNATKRLSRSLEERSITDPNSKLNGLKWLS